MSQIPFRRDRELYCKLGLSPDQSTIRRNPPPEGTTRTEKTSLPGQPRIDLQGLETGTYLLKDLLTPRLNTLSPHLWLVGKQDSSHVSSLSHQIVRGRNIVITEDPELHLVWIEDRIFIKPIPKYLLSHAFWDFYLVSNISPLLESERQNIAKAARGFLRSYAYLIQHRSDFLLARDDKHILLPKNVSYAKFIDFITEFEDVKDADVSPRYSFGELRLTRLNFWVKIFLRRFTFQKVDGQYNAYFARFYGPILFIFGTFSVVLNAMQVALAVQPVIQLSHSWIVFARISRGFSVLTLLVVAVIVLFLISTLVFLILRETIFAVKEKRRQHRDVYQATEAEKGRGSGIR